jgi:glucokinase
VTRLVAIDIGGTHARFALAEVEGARVVSLAPEVTFKTAEHASVQSAWDAYGKVVGRRLPPMAAIAVAAPLGGDVIRFTNNPWLLRPDEIGAELGLESHIILNDFEAVAHAVAQVDSSHFVHICGPAGPLPSTGTISVIGPGTGLGVATLHRGPGGDRVCATEGGHIGFAPTDPVEDEILQRLRRIYARVSIERVISGPGLAAIHWVLAQSADEPPVRLDDAALWSLALSGDDPVASAALDRFLMALGAASGDLALAHGAVGVVIAGGLSHRMRHSLTGSRFAERFRDKGRFAAMMDRISVKLITHPQPGLFGAAAAYASKLGTG